MTVEAVRLEGPRVVGTLRTNLVDGARLAITVRTTEELLREFVTCGEGSASFRFEGAGAVTNGRYAVVASFVLEEQPESVRAGLRHQPRRLTATSVLRVEDQVDPAPLRSRLRELIQGANSVDDAAKLTPLVERARKLDQELWLSTLKPSVQRLRSALEAATRENPDYTRTLAAFEEVGAEASYRAFSGALAWFPGSRAPEDKEARLKVVEALPASELKRVNTLFWHDDETFRTRLASYIRANRNAIDEILRDYERARFDPPKVEGTLKTRRLLAGDLAVDDLVDELIRRLVALSPEGCLAVKVSKRTAAHIVQWWRELSDGEIDMPEPDLVREFLVKHAQQLACWVVRAEHPSYWIRRMPPPPAP